MVDISPKIYNIDVMKNFCFLIGNLCSDNLNNIKFFLNTQIICNIEKFILDKLDLLNLEYLEYILYFFHVIMGN